MVVGWNRRKDRRRNDEKVDEDKILQFANPEFRQGHYLQQEHIHEQNTNSFVNFDEIFERKLKILRSRSARAILITLGKRSSEEIFGLSFIPIDPSLSLVKEIQKGSIADLKGIKEGDYVINNEKLSLTLERVNQSESYGFSLSTTKENVHFARGIKQGSIAELNGLEDGDCIIEINDVCIKLKNNKEALNLVKQIPTKVKLLIWKKSSYESSHDINSNIDQFNKIELKVLKKVAYQLYAEHRLKPNGEYPIKFDNNRNKKTPQSKKNPDTKFNLSSSLSITWLGEACAFVHLDGINFIIDPLWTNNPIYKRYKDPVISMDEIPPLHFGIISNIYNFDVENVIYLAKKSPNMEWFVPLGIKKWLYDRIPNKKVHELSWGCSMFFPVFPQVYQIWCVPAKNGLPMKELWCGWVVIGPYNRFYHAGSTGYWEQEFHKIGAKLGPFDLATIPIGYSTPSSNLMIANSHLSPPNAVKTHKIVQSKKTIAIQWGTYEWEPDNDQKAKDNILECIKEDSDLQNSFIILNEGEDYVVSPKTPDETTENA
uniref:PDZ domain-containing protein n=1 Tax=Acrobeloides nanus TaxID=290746 RepID=A0A914CTE1_9BILA